MQKLTIQFTDAFSKIELGARRAVAMAAHAEVRALLARDDTLSRKGFETALIGSYPRDLGIWPGKDVDVFGKFTELTVDDTTPETIYNDVLNPLAAAYGERVTPQPRSVKVLYQPGSMPARAFLAMFDAPEAPDFEFSVDVVPAARWEDRWGIPNRNPDLWAADTLQRRWVETDPEKLNDLTTELNAAPTISGRGVYLPVTKSIKQIRRHHLGDTKPGGLYYELIMHEAFTDGYFDDVDTWADAMARASTYVADRLGRAGSDPVCDPVLDRPFQPGPDPQQLAGATAVFERLADAAREALTASDGCAAAAAWRRIYGQRPDGVAAFPLPPGCREDGSVMPPPVANPLRGSDEARGFGGH